MTPGHIQCFCPCETVGHGGVMSWSWTKRPATCPTKKYRGSTCRRSRLQRTSCGEGASSNPLNKTLVMPRFWQSLTTAFSPPATNHDLDAQPLRVWRVLHTLHDVFHPKSPRSLCTPSQNSLFIRPHSGFQNGLGHAIAPAWQASCSATLNQAWMFSLCTFLWRNAQQHIYRLLSF